MQFKVLGTSVVKDCGCIYYCESDIVRIAKRLYIGYLPIDGEEDGERIYNNIMHSIAKRAAEIYVEKNNMDSIPLCSDIMHAIGDAFRELEN